MNDVPVVDTNQIERLVEWGGAGLKTKMVDLFLSHASGRLDEIRGGLASGIAEEAERAAHTLKSSAGNVGAQRVQSLAQEAETLAEEGKMEELRELLPNLENEFHIACDALKALMEGASE